MFDTGSCLIVSNTHTHTRKRLSMCTHSMLCIQTMPTPPTRTITTTITTAITITMTTAPTSRATTVPSACLPTHT